MVELQAQVFDLCDCTAFAGFLEQLVHVEVIHQTLFSEQDRFFGGAAYANAQHTRGAPTRAHGGNRFENPVDHAVAGVQHDHLGFVFAAATLCRNDDV